MSIAGGSMSVAAWQYMSVACGSKCQWHVTVYVSGSVVVFVSGRWQYMSVEVGSICQKLGSEFFV